MLKSYYEILNVRSDSSKSEIKNQFRKLVRMYHPDVNTSCEAEEIFKLINKAAEVLLDDEKRKNYDILRNTQNKNFKDYSKAQSSNYAFNDLFSKRKEKEEFKKQKAINGDDITINVTIDYFEAIIGTNRSINISNSKICNKCNGKKFANGAKCIYCNGTGEITTNKKITVKIPPKIKNKLKMDET